jgi:general secretion pathway protein G
MHLTALELPPTTQASRRLARRASTRGMTLIEILVVLAIIGLIMGGVAVMASNALDNARIDTAGKDIKTFVGGVEMYSIQKKGKCPKSLDDLKAAGVIKAINKDPWGNDYVLKCPGEHGDVDISSAGPDGEFGNEDDINSWDDESAKEDKKE